MSLKKGKSNKIRLQTLSLTQVRNNPAYYLGKSAYTLRVIYNRAVTKIMRFFFLMGIQGSFKNIFSRLEVCIKIFYYSRKTPRISVTFIGIGDGGDGGFFLFFPTLL